MNVERMSFNPAHGGKCMSKGREEEEESQAKESGQRGRSGWGGS